MWKWLRKLFYHFNSPEVLIFENFQNLYPEAQERVAELLGEMVDSPPVEIRVRLNYDKNVEVRILSDENWKDELGSILFATTNGLYDGLFFEELAQTMCKGHGKQVLERWIELNEKANNMVEAPLVGPRQVFPDDEN